MGPYCKFCGTRCFVPFPMQTPTEAIAAYRPGISIIATCREGQAAEKRDTGWCYDDIKGAIDAIPPRLCTHCGAVLNDPYSPDYCTHCYSWNESETTAADAVAEMRECAVCGQVRSDCASQTPASETEVADIYVCADCRDALAAGECA